jgi:phosphoglycolate phosphatase-like HAD superfamily hydrolase
MVQSTTGRSGTDLEREIQAEIRNRPPLHDPRSTHFGAPTVGAPALGMPDYVEHREGATEIGKLSAEAVVREYEETAKEIESMGAELVERVKQCEAMTRDALSVTAELREIAARYREEARRSFDHIEACSLVVAEVRKTCAELKDKIPVMLVTDRMKPRKK